MNLIFQQNLLFGLEKNKVWFRYILVEYKSDVIYKKFFWNCQVYVKNDKFIYKSCLIYSIVKITLNDMNYWEMWINII